MLTYLITCYILIFMSKWKNSESWNRGQAVESEFSKLMDIRKLDYRKASKKEQFKHIDYHSSFGTIDVKAKKRLNRGDGEEQDEFIWLEFKNVQGKAGWLCGETNVIAFERDNDFVLVKRKDLLNMALKKCDLNRRVNYSKDALYKGYTRKGRKDLITIVKMSDILQINHKIWKKNKKF
jgi:hypothetical protein